MTWPRQRLRIVLMVVSALAAVVWAVAGVWHIAVTFAIAAGCFGLAATADWGWRNL